MENHSLDLASNALTDSNIQTLYRKVAELDSSNDPDLTELSLDDLIDLVGNQEIKNTHAASSNDVVGGTIVKRCFGLPLDNSAITHAPPNAQYVGGVNSNSSSGFGLQLSDLLDTRNYYRNHYGLSRPKIDFAVNPDNDVSSYIDCMQPFYPNETVSSSATPGEPSSTSSQSCYSYVHSDTLSSCLQTPSLFGGINVTTTTTAAIESETVPGPSSHVASFLRQNSDTSSSSDSDCTIKVSGSKRPLDAPTQPRPKRGKPSQEWEVIDEMILNEEIDEVTIKKIKNNEASRLHRVKKKQKYKELFKRQTELEKSNAELSIKAEVMQREVDLLKQMLITKMKGSSSKQI